MKHEEKTIEEKLPIVETFVSIQGEGFFSGEPAFFIRLGGCDVCCTWCDEKVAWDDKLYPLISIKKLAKSALESNMKTIVITGGEPFRYDLTNLSILLKKNNQKCIVETSGTSKITGVWDWIALSPKKKQEPLFENYKIANELKVVIQKEDDFIWAEKNASLSNQNAIFSLQPEWTSFIEIINPIINYIKENPKWRLSVQVHKFLNIP